MSQTPPAAPAPAPTPAPAPANPPLSRPAESVIVRPWPKVVFLYPTFIVATIFFLLSWLGVGKPENGIASPVLGNCFMLVLLLNLLVFSFDFSRIKSITILFAIIAIVLAVLLLDLTGYFGRLFRSIDIEVNTAFFGFLSAGMGVLLLTVWINARFNYYEINAREILHHHGYLGDVQRWSTEGLEMNKEIYDVVEFLLLRSGRLILQPATSKKAIVLDNIANVNRIEKSVNDLLSVVAVRMNQHQGPG